MKNLSPISYEFIAAGVARRARMALCNLKPSQVNTEKPSWNGNGGNPDTVELTVPITERSYWEGRYVLTELTLRKEGDDTLVINDATVSVSREKQVVRTTLVGLDGTIKEYICSGDYSITITVGIVAVNGGHIVDEYPEEGIRRVREFLDENKAVEVSSVFFSIFDIDHLVFTGFSLNQSTDSSRQIIEIKALSDDDYVIKSTEY